MQAQRRADRRRRTISSASARSATSTTCSCIVDEVITGFGRTGRWFAIEHYGIEPDIMTMAKAMTAGYIPMGAVIARTEIVDALPIFRHVHTFSGHGGGAAAATAVHRHQGARRADRQGARQRRVLPRRPQGCCSAALPIVGEVRGIGMWLAVDFTTDKKTKAPFADDTVKAVVRRMNEHGVLASADRHPAFEMAPPLISEREHLDRAARAAAEAVFAVTKERGLG